MADTMDMREHEHLCRYGGCIVMLLCRVHSPRGPIEMWVCPKCLQVFQFIDFDLTEAEMELYERRYEKIKNWQKEGR